MGAAPLLQPGTIVQNRYRVVRQVGAGGMGAVYEATDGRLGNVVALKQRLLDDILSEQAFEREAQVLAALRHAALPVVIDYFSEANGHFLVMQYIPGDDLQTMLARQRRPFDIDEVLQWSLAILDALVYLHGRQPAIVHRDIKPANLKLTPDGEIVLLDFGLVKGPAQNQPPVVGGRTVFGWTPQYAPPEQIQGMGTDARTDLYALGATLYHLLTGRTPAGVPARDRARMDGQTDPLPPVHAVNAAVPRVVGEVVARAMALDPADRPRSAAEMKAALATSVASPDTVPVRGPAAAKTRRVDAAVPSQAEVGRRIDLIVQVRFAESPRLGLEDWPSRHLPDAIEQASEQIRLTYPTDPITGRPGPARLTFKVLAPDFDVEGQPHRIVDVPPDRYSNRILFGLTAKRQGLCRITLEVYGEGSTYLGAVPAETEVGAAVVEPVAAYGVTNLVLQVIAREVARMLESQAETPARNAEAARNSAPAEAAATARASAVDVDRDHTGAFAIPIPPAPTWSPPKSAEPEPAAPAGGGRSSIARWGLWLAPVAALALVTAVGLQWLTSPAGGPPPVATAPPPAAGPPPTVAAAPSTVAAPGPVAAPPPPAAGASPSVAAPPRPVPAAPGPSGPGRPASPPDPSAGVTRLTPGTSLQSLGRPGVSMTLVSLQPSGDARVRLTMTFRNMSAEDAELALDYRSLVIADARGGACRVTGDSAGTNPAAMFRTVIPSGSELRHWIECRPADPDTWLLLVRFGRLPAESGQVRFPDFEAARSAKPGDRD